MSSAGVMVTLGLPGLLSCDENFLGCMSPSWAGFLAPPVGVAPDCGPGKIPEPDIALKGACGESVRKTEEREA